jgi:hypothetical protein
VPKVCNESLISIAGSEILKPLTGIRRMLNIGRLLLIACLSAILLIIPTQAAVDDPTQFVLQYYQAKSVAKTPLDTNGYLSARLLAKQPAAGKLNGPDAAMLEMVSKMMDAQQPKKVRVLNCSGTAQKATLELEAIEVPQHFKDEGRNATSWSFKGFVDLVKEKGAWKVDRDMWTFSSQGKNGKMSESFGLSGEEDKPAASHTDRMPSLAPTDFEGQVREKLAKSCKYTGKGEKIYAVIVVDANGKLTGLKVRGEKPQAHAEQQITDAMVNSQPFMPLAAKYKTQRNIWMMFDWSENGSSVSGPYFSADPHPGWIMEIVGLK